MKRPSTLIALLLCCVIILASCLWFFRSRPSQRAALVAPQKSDTGESTAKRLSPAWGVALKHINETVVSPDRQLLVMATGRMQGSTQEGISGQIQVWDFKKRALLARLCEPEFFHDVDISVDKNSIASCNWSSIVKLWSIAGKKVVRQFKDPDNYWVASVAFSPNGKWLATGLGGPGSNGDIVRLWDLQTGKVIRTIKAKASSASNGLTFSPDGNRLAFGAQVWNEEGYPAVYDLANSGGLQSFGNKDKLILEVAFSPDGKQLASRSYKGNLQFWDISSGKTLPHPPESENPVSAFAYSEDGQWLATAREDANSIKIWNTRSWTVKYILDGHIVNSLRLVQSNDQEIIVVGTTTSGIRLWSVNLGLKK